MTQKYLIRAENPDWSYLTGCLPGSWIPCPNCTDWIRHKGSFLILSRVFKI
jgi:hypothetical protein